MYSTKKNLKTPPPKKKKSPKKYFKKGDLPTSFTHKNTQKHATTHNNTQQHTPTHNNTQQHYTTALEYTKLPMYQLFLWRLYIMVLRGATSLLGALEGVGPENREFFGP
jgi:hypothetical protein